MEQDQIPEEDGAKILLTSPQSEDTTRTPKADDQRRTKKIRWRKMTEEHSSKQ